MKLVLALLVICLASPLSLAAVQNCKTLVTGSQDKCQECNANYLPKKDQTACAATIKNCKFVDNTTVANCAECQEGWNLASNKCESCKTDYLPSVDGSKCGKSIANCAKLDNADLTKCKECKTGNKLSTDGKKCESSSSSGVVTSFSVAIVLALFALAF